MLADVAEVAATMPPFAMRVEPAVARALLERLADGFEAHDIEAVGLDVWHYAGGPWRSAEALGFAAVASRPT